MNSKIGYLLLATVAIAAIVMLGGCKKKEQPAPAPTKAPTIEDVAKKATATAKDAEKTATVAAEEAKKTAAAVVAAVEQTICPVMENPINKQYFTEYKGKKVYFCCPDCKAKFEAEPEKYLAKLPQFK